MPLGLQAAQVAHAIVEFSIEYPELTTAWNNISNYVVILTCRDEDGLLDLADLYVWKFDCPAVVFHEPDLGDKGEHTAMALLIIPNDDATFHIDPHKFIKSLPLLKKGGEQDD